MDPLASGVGEPETNVNERARTTLVLLCLLAIRAPAGAAQDAVVLPAPGLYASRQFVSNRALTRPANRYVRVRTTSVLLHRVHEAAGGLAVESRYCSVEQEPLGRVRTSLGPEFVAAMPAWEARLAADPEGETPGAVVVEEQVMVLGATLEDPASDALPTDSDDPRVTDPDADGHPGVTVDVEGYVSGQVYLVQRLVRGLRGRLDGDGRITGTVTGTGDQVVIGASNVILKTFTPRFEHNPDPERNTFVWVPVPDDATCASVLADRVRLFGDD